MWYIRNRWNKYRNEKTTRDGIVFDSKKEARRYSQLKALESAGKIYELERQVHFELIPNQRTSKELLRKCEYVADFTYKDEEGNYIVEDTKGFRTDVYKIKKKLMYYFHNIEIKEV